MNDSNIVQKFIWLSERTILLTIALATLFATASEIIRIIEIQEVNLSDLFLLFILFINSNNFLFNCQVSRQNYQV